MIDKAKNILVTMLFTLFISLTFCINCFTDDKIISVSERRKLEQVPKLSAKAILDGTYFKKVDSYVTDQFIKRDDLRKLKIYTELNIMRKSNYNSLYEHQGYIINQTYPLNEKSVKYIIKKMQDINLSYLTDTNNIYFTIIPDKNYFVDCGNLKLDYTKMERLMIDNLNNMKYIDIFDTLNLNDYYKTDTHWKQENLVKVAKIILENMNISANLNFTKEELSTFKGVYSGQFPISKEKDSLVILSNNTIKNMIVYNYENKTTTSVYDRTKLNALDKYDIYLSGAAPLLTITNTQNTNSRELIVFRDSYGSSLIPLLSTEYSKVTVIDTRYISPKMLGNYVDFKNKDILFLYSSLVINESFGLK